MKVRSEGSPGPGRSDKEGVRKIHRTLCRMKVWKGKELSQLPGFW